MKKFAELVRQRSGGKMKVNLFSTAPWARIGRWCHRSNGGTVELAVMNTPAFLTSETKGTGDI